MGKIDFSMFLSTCGISNQQHPVAEQLGFKNVFWMYGLFVEDEFGISRDELRHRLAQRGIETRTFFIPIHLQPIYYNHFKGQKFPVAEELCFRGLYLPSASGLTTEEIRFVCQSVKECRK